MPAEEGGSGSGSGSDDGSDDGSLYVDPSTATHDFRNTHDELDLPIWSLVRPPTSALQAA